MWGSIRALYNIKYSLPDPLCEWIYHLWKYRDFSYKSECHVRSSRWECQSHLDKNVSTCKAAKIFGTVTFSLRQKYIKGVFRQSLFCILTCQAQSVIKNADCGAGPFGIALPLEGPASNVFGRLGWAIFALGSSMVRRCSPLPLHKMNIKKMKRWLCSL